MGPSDVNLQWTTLTNTTIADHGRRWQKWPPSAPHEALRTALTHQMVWGQPPSKQRYFGGLLRVCMALKTLQCCGNSSLLEQKSALRAIQTLTPPKKYTRKLGGLSSIHLKRWRGVQGLMWGARGPFPPAAAMVVAIVTPVVFCAEATEKCNQNTKISCL